MPSYKNPRLVSYECPEFDTFDGDLGIGQYADDLQLDATIDFLPTYVLVGYYIRTKPKNQGQFEWVDLTYSVVGLKKVNIVAGNAYYDEFLTAFGITSLAQSLAMATPTASLSAGYTIRVRTTAKAYDAGRYIKDTPVPSRDEVVAVMPPAILGIPAEKQFNAPLLETINEFLFQKTGQHHSIGYDTTSSSGAVGAVSSYSWNHTCGGGANLLVFGDGLYHNGTNDYTVASVTYNAVDMTYVRSDKKTTTYILRTTIYYLYAPTTGSAKSVAVTYSGTVDQGVGGVVSYSGAGQSGQPDAHNGATGTSTTPTVNVTTVVDNCWVFSVVYTANQVFCNNTERWNAYAVGGSDTGAPKTPPGAQTMSWTQASGNWAISAASFAPVLDYPQSASVDMGLAATASRAITTARTASTSLGAGLTVSRSWGRYRTASTELGLVPTVIKDFGKSVSLALGLTSTASRAITISRTSSHTLGLAAITSRVITITRTSLTNLGLDLTVSRAISVARSASVAMGFAASVLKGIGLTASTSLGLAVTASRAIAVSRTASNEIGLAVTATRTIVINRVVSLALDLVATVSRLADYPRTASHALGLVSSASRLINVARTASNEIGTSITVTRRTVFSRVGSVVMGFALTVSRAVVAVRTASNSLGLSATASRLSNYPRSASHALGLALTVSRAIAVTRTASHALGLTATATRAITIARSASHAMGLVASVTKDFGKTASVTIGYYTLSWASPRIKRRISTTGTNRTISTTGTNRDRTDTGTNRDREPW